MDSPPHKLDDINLHSKEDALLNSNGKPKLVVNVEATKIEKFFVDGCPFT